MQIIYTKKTTLNCQSKEGVESELVFCLFGADSDTSVHIAKAYQIGPVQRANRYARDVLVQFVNLEIIHGF